MGLFCMPCLYTSARRSGVPVGVPSGALTGSANKASRVSLLVRSRSRRALRFPAVSIDAGLGCRSCISEAGPVLLWTDSSASHIRATNEKSCPSTASDPPHPTRFATPCPQRTSSAAAVFPPGSKPPIALCSWLPDTSVAPSNCAEVAAGLLRGLSCTWDPRGGVVATPWLPGTSSCLHAHDAAAGPLTDACCRAEQSARPASV